MGLVKGKSGQQPLASQTNILHAIPVTTSAFGQTIAVIYGKNRIPGELLDYVDFISVAHTSTQQVGGKGGFGAQSTAKTTYTYQAAVTILLCEGPVNALRNIYDTNGKLTLLSITEPFVVPAGGGNVTPTVPGNGRFFADAGVGFDTAFSQVVNDFGSDGSRTLSGTYRVPLSKVVSSPSTGQYAVNASSGVYTFAVADAGKTAQITYHYSIPNQNANDTSPPTQLDLTLFTGTTPQTAWGYMTTKHPDHALSYARMAYVADSAMDLGSGGNLPNFTYEIVGFFPFGAGIEDANPRDIVNDLFTNVFHGAALPASYVGDLTAFSNYCVASGIFFSPILNQQQSVAATADNIINLANSAAVVSEGVIKVIPYGDQSQAANGAIYVPNTTPIYDLGITDFIHPGQDTDPITFSVAGASGDVPLTNVMTVEVLDRSSDYNPVPVEDKDESSVQIYGYRPASIVSAHEICDVNIGKTVVMALNRRTVNIRTKYKFSLPVRYILLEPMDLVTLTDGGTLNKIPVRITQVTENEDGQLDFEAEEFPWGTATATLYPAQSAVGFSPQSLADPGNINQPIVFEVPKSLSVSGQHEIWMGLSGGAVTNNALWSEQIDNAVYVKDTGVTVTANTQVDPNGGTTADVITSGAVNTGVTQTLGTTAVNGTPTTFSVWLKVASNQNVTLQIDRGAGLDAQTQVVTVTNVWKRYSFTHTSAWSGTTAIRIRIQIANASTQVFAWGIQAEQSPAAGSYLQTQAAVITAGNSNWGGCSVWISQDDSTYERVGRVFGPSRQGFLTADVASGSDPDTVNSIPVDLTSSLGTLTSGTTQDADTYRTLCWCDGEFISYRDANLTGTNQYNVGSNAGGTKYLRRGLFGSQITSHLQGTQFTRLDNAVFVYQFDQAFIGKTIFLKFTSFNTSGLQEQSLDNVTQFQFFVLGRFASNDRVEKNILPNPGFELNVTNTPLATDIALGSKITDYWTRQNITALTGHQDGTTLFKAGFEDATHDINGGSSGRVRSGLHNFVFMLKTSTSIPINTPPAFWQSSVVSDLKVPVLPGEAYAFGGFFAWDAGANIPAGLTVVARFDLIVYDTAGNQITTVETTAGLLSGVTRNFFTNSPNGTYVPIAENFNIPSSVNGKTPGYVGLALSAFIQNVTGSPITTPAQSCAIFRFDDLYIVPQWNGASDEVSNNGTRSVAYTGVLTYNSNTTAITWNWNLNISKTNIPMSIPNFTGSQTITGLTSGQSYNFYPLIDEFNQIVSMVATGGVGTPSWAHIGTNVAWTQEQARTDHFPLSSGPMNAVPATGGGGSGGGVGGSCILAEVLCETKERGVIPHAELEVGMWVRCPVDDDTPDGWVEVEFIQQNLHTEWVHSHFNINDWIVTTPGHSFTLDNDELKKASQLSLDDPIPCLTGVTFLIAHSYERYTAQKTTVRIKSKRHVYYAGMKQPQILQHNQVVGT